jgi:hypothetical protein
MLLHQGDSGGPFFLHGTHEVGGVISRALIPSPPPRCALNSTLTISVAR